MLSEIKKQESLLNVQDFLNFLDERPECPLRKVNVLVEGSKQCHYRNINMSITFDYKQEGYRIALIWENDITQPEYKSLGLHGEYSSSYQSFKFQGGTLSFADGNNQISIIPQF